MGVIASAMATWRTALAAAPASLTNLPEGVMIEDTPAADKTYFAVLMGETAEAPLGPEFGTNTLYGDNTTIRVVVNWPFLIDQESHAGTIADDIQNIRTVMLKAANRGTDVMLISPGGHTLERMGEGDWTQGTILFHVKYRVTADMT